MIATSTGLSLMPYPKERGNLAPHLTVKLEKQTHKANNVVQGTAQYATLNMFKKFYHRFY